MDDEMVKKVHAALIRLYEQNMNEPVSATQINRLRIRYNGKIITLNDIKDALNMCWKRGIAYGDIFPGKQMRYVPLQTKTFPEKVVEAVLDGFRSAQFFDHLPSDEEILDVLRDKFRYMVGIYMKTEMLTRDGAIARQLVERLHLEYFVIHPGVPVRASFLLTADGTAVIRSTLAERKKMLDRVVNS